MANNTGSAADSHEIILVLDFGGQYNQLIARRVRENHVYCEVHPHTMPLDKIRAMAPKGIILTGGPNSVYAPDAATAPAELFELGIPVLGICYGSQLMAHVLGGKVETAPTSEYGRTEVTINDAGQRSKLFEGVSAKTICWMSHTDYISAVPDGFTITAETPVCPVAAMEDASRQLYSTQFHPEVMHTVEGKTMLKNFVFAVCGCAGDWHMGSFVERTIRELRAKIGTGKALCALSGGVDSSVAAVILSKAIGKQLGYLKRNICSIEKMLYSGKEIPIKFKEKFSTIQTIYAQQKEMYDNRTHSVKDRIVSLSQPWVRPIVRGKAKAKVEFGIKLDISVCDGWTRLERHSFDAYNESTGLQDMIEKFKERTGHYPERVLADKIYRNRDNLSFCKQRNIRLSGPALGRPKKDTKTEKKQNYIDECERIEVERKFSLAKRKCGMGMIVTRLKETTCHSIAMSVLLLNLRKIEKLRVEISALLFHSLNFAFIQ